MILLTKKMSLATLVLLSVAALPSFAQSQNCADCVGSDVGWQYTDVGAEYAEFGHQYAEIGETGGYFEQAATCGCRRGGCGRRNGKFRSIARALRPFGDSSCYESYRSVFGGWSELEDEGGSIVLDGLEFNDGFVLGTAKGIYLNNNTRIERETTWRNNTVEGVNVVGQTLELEGRMNNFSNMVNVIREFRPDKPVRPYAGLGVGVSRQDGEFSINGVDLDADDWAFAYQGIVGLKFVKSRRVSLFAEYRYFGNTETNLQLSAAGGPRTDLSDFEYTSENIVFGFQFKR